MKKYSILISILIVFVSALTAAPYTQATIDRGHRILIDKGLQIQAQSFWSNDPNIMDENIWGASNFTTFNDQAIRNFPYLESNINQDWATWAWRDPGDGTNYFNNPQLFLLPQEAAPYLDRLISFQLRDEMGIDYSFWRDEAAEWIADCKVLYPDTLLFTNQHGGQISEAGMLDYMSVAQPDMVMFDTYPFNGNSLANRTPTTYYEHLAKYRSLGLKGNDGMGEKPIPYGLYLHTFRIFEEPWTTPNPTDSQMRLNQFSAWTFGYKYASAFVYGSMTYSLRSNLFWLTTTIDEQTPNSHFYHIAETNRQSLNLAPSLVRLHSTDVFFLPGQNNDSAEVQTNPVPSNVQVWSTFVDPYQYITQITASNLGSLNSGLKGDVLLGYFVPLIEEDGDDIYFMITNGLCEGTDDPWTQADGLVAYTRQKITVEFDFTNLPNVDSLLKLSRQHGKVEVIPLQSLGGSSYSLELTLDGGTGDLFKFNDGTPFIAAEYLYGSCLDVLGAGYSLPTDLNNDCIIDLKDFAILAENWLKSINI